MGEALRLVGLDEVSVAQNLAGIVETLSVKKEVGDGVAKLYVDVLKECARHLDSPRPQAPGPAAGDMLVTVNLIHEVQRPVRPTAATIAAAAAGTVANPEAIVGTSALGTIAIHPAPPAEEGLPM